MSELKKAVGEAALPYVEDGMRLGIGTGSTAEAFIELLAERVDAGLSIIGVPTSERTAHLCTEFGIPLSSLDETPELDLTIDGADEIGTDLALIKGAGGALLREKIVATASAKMIVIADESKKVVTLGAFPLAIEVAEFGLEATKRAIAAAAQRVGCEGELTVRTNRDGAVRTDGGNLLIDAAFGRIERPADLACELSAVPGVMEHGLFVGIADLALVSSPDGIELIEREARVRAG